MNYLEMCLELEKIKLKSLNKGEKMGLKKVINKKKGSKTARKYYNMAKGIKS